MPNLYHSINSLLEFCNTKKPNESQRLFLLDLVNGNSDRASLNNIILYRKREQLAKLRKIIEQEVDKTPYWNNSNYVMLLKGVLKDIQATQKTEEFVKLPWKERPKEYKKELKTYETLYSVTSNKFHGTLIIPIRQGLDPRFGNSLGECFGYVTKWAVQLYQQKKAFGIPLNSEPLFNFKASLWRRYSDTHHMAPLTPDIILYQKNQRRLNEILATLPILRGGRSGLIYYNPSTVDMTFYTSPYQIAEKLIECTSKDPKTIYNLKLCKYFLEGHALGFYKINKTYHFIDSNSGWFRFENANDFKNWLPFYFKCLEYDRLYGEYAIGSYSLFSSIEVPESTRLETIIFLPIVVSVALTIFAFFFIKHFIINGLGYLYLNIKDLFYTPENFAENISSVASEIPERLLPKSLEPLDLATPPSKIKKDISQEELNLKKIASLVDTPSNKLAQVQKKALDSELFKTSLRNFFLERNTQAAEKTSNYQVTYKN